MATIYLEPQEAVKQALFDRATLQFTVALIRPHNPSLALRIQNLLAPSAKTYRQFDDQPSPKDLYKLTLDSFTLKRVVDTLAIAGQELAEKVLETLNGDHEHLLITKATIGKWLLYAQYHQSEYDKFKQKQI
ncbi:MAG: hypothetical protein ACI95C_000524 [Pseudohongiellaceae bacterium]|jgi:hypothetical protein